MRGCAYFKRYLLGYQDLLFDAPKLLRGRLCFALQLRLGDQRMLQLVERLPVALDQLVKPVCMGNRPQGQGRVVVVERGVGPTRTSCWAARVRQTL